MKKRTKISTLIAFLLIIGTVFANLNAIVSIMPRNTVERDVNRVDNCTPIADFDELDVKTLTETANYISDQASQNNFVISTTVYSSGLLFESDNSLIIIGHGHLSSNGQYFIADYSTNRIIKMAENKEVVALLACNSNNLALENNIQLTYTDSIDLRTALQDLTNLLDWTVSHEFLPSANIQLFDLDPGDPVNGWSKYNPPPTFNLQKMAYCPEDNIYWILQTTTGVQSLSTYLLNHKMNAVRFYLIGDFLSETSPNSNSYYLNRIDMQYDAWISEGGGRDYLNFANTIINGVEKNDYHGSIKVSDILSQMMSAQGLSLSEAQFALAGIFGLVGAILFSAAIPTFKAVIGVACSTLVVLGWIAGVIALLLGITLIVLCLVYGISAYINRNV